MYQERPSVCRMFGVAGYFDKNHDATLAICREIREQYSIAPVPTVLNRYEVPMIADWSFKMSSIDPDLIKEKLPLNKALLIALDKVALFSQYHDQEK